MNEYVGADALHPPAMSRFYRDDVGIVPYKKMHNLPDKSPIYRCVIAPITPPKTGKSANHRRLLPCQTPFHF